MIDRAHTRQALHRVAQNLRDTAQLVETLIETERTPLLSAVQTGAPAPVEAGRDHDLATYTRQLIKARRRIVDFFDSDLFADPARDILLDLFLAAEEDREVYVSSCCLAAAVPPTTALRWIQQLKDRALIVERDDPGDGRRKWLRLTPTAYQAVRDYVLATAQTLPPAQPGSQAPAE